MLHNFSAIMQTLYELEGGYVEDSGGPTNLGITARAWAAWINKPLSTITPQIMKAITVPMAMPFYQAQYWNMIDGNELPTGIDAMVFHFEVNAGSRSVKMLQHILEVTEDGIVGPETRLALVGYMADNPPGTLIDVLGAKQILYYRSLADFPIYGRGWLRRVQTFQRLAHNLPA